MSNELNVRVGDVVRLKPMRVTNMWHNSVDVKVLGLADSMISCFETDVVEIISRAETPQEEIARLKAELAKALRWIKWDGGDCPIIGNPRKPIAIELRGGSRIINQLQHCNWGHDDTGGDIIAYMELPE